MKIKDYPNYEISNLGNVKSLFFGRTNKPKKLKSLKLKNGYLAVGLINDSGKKTTLIHRIVAETFLENNLNKRCVNHIDGNKENNIVTNLEWNTHLENNRHAIKIGLINTKGERCGTSKITEIQAIEIKKSNLKLKELSLIYGLSQPALSQIRTGQRWNHLK